MVAASQFSIIGGGSLGPEAPLVAICAALAGFISRSVFKVTERNLIRKHTVRMYYFTILFLLLLFIQQHSTRINEMNEWMDVS